MTDRNFEWEHDWSVAPGEILAEALEERGLSQSELARRMGRPTKTINEIVNGKAALTPETAIQLQLVLGISASLWTGLEANYRQALAHDRLLLEFTDERGWLNAFPLSDLRRRGLVDDAPPGRQVAQLLSFFGVASPDAWRHKWGQPAVEFRQSNAFQGSDHARSAWLRWGEILAAETEVPLFDPKALHVAVRELPSATRLTPFDAAIDAAKTMLGRAGVVLVVLPEFEGTRLSGAARWPSTNRAIVQLSLRYKTDDQFWFSCLHEVGHILDRPRTNFLDGEDLNAPQEEHEREEFANAFARNALIAPDAWTRFSSAGHFEAEAVREFAAEENVSPGIVVGRLQHDGLLDHNRLNHLKRPIDVVDR